MSVESEPLLCEALRAQANAMRQMANIMDTLAIANAGGKDSDLLKSSDVQRILNCGASKASGIIRVHGTGKGKMGRIERGLLLTLQREGEL